MNRVCRPRALRRQGGAYAVIYAIALPAMLGMIGLAIDLSVVYARGHELQTIADAAALAAARSLNGTVAGLTAAKNSARVTAQKNKFRFLNAETISWSADALSFSVSTSGPWLPAEAISASDVGDVLYTKVDTSALDSIYGKVSTVFLRVVGVDAEQNLSRTAIAGRSMTSMIPLAICALNNTKITSRTNAPSTGVEEMLEHGFRRGVSYNLLNLNPNGTTPKYYVFNPFEVDSMPPAASHLTPATLRPLMCTGAIPAPVIRNGTQLNVSETFSSDMVADLNSRFGTYSGGSLCTKYSAPPDVNVIDFRGGYTNWWMNASPAPIQGSASSLTTNGKLLTIADVNGASAGTTNASYGPLWSFSRPVRYNSSTGTEGVAFTRTDWAKLYLVSSGAAPASTYAFTASPYDRNATPNLQTPIGMAGVGSRRVLNVALLECPVASGSTRANVLGIGRFLMTTPATTSPLAIHAEFGGLTQFGALTASAVLYK